MTSVGHEVFLRSRFGRWLFGRAQVGPEQGEGAHRVFDQQGPTGRAARPEEGRKGPHSIARVDAEPLHLQALLEEHEGDLMGLLLAVNARLGFLPRDRLGEIAARTGIPLARLLGIATFYRCFRLEPRGRSVVAVCCGTACHVAGGPQLAESLARRLDIEVGQTSQDGALTLETVACVGCCSLAPVIQVDAEVRGRVRHREMQDLIDDLVGGP